MATTLRVRTPSAGRKISTPEIWLPPHVRYEINLPVPDPVTFAISERWLDRTLYPRQATMLKVIFLRDDLLTDYDLAVIAEWEESFRLTGNNGTPSGLLARMQYLRATGHHWFRELILVLGRRAGKGFICAIAMSYVLWTYMAKFDPQAFYEIDRDKQLTCLIYAGRKDQARDNLWRDLVNMIQGAPCFHPYLSRPMGESLSIYAPADMAKIETLSAKGIRSGLDQATFKIDPLPATPMSGRGGAGFMMGLDEMGHMVATGANRSSDEVWVAATPSLDQFGKDAFIACPSSPWEMIGQLYVEWQHSQLVDEETGEYVYPEIFMLQLASWEPYYDWEIAHQIDLFPEDFSGDLNEYALVELPKLPVFQKPVIAYDDQMRRLEKADPDTFAVERLSHWQSSLDAYLDPNKIAEMFDNDLVITTSGPLNMFYKGHADPAFVNDNFGVAVAHTVADELGYDHVVFDYIHHWDPADFVNHTIDYIEISGHLWNLIKGFPIDDFSFDQHQSQPMLAELTRKVREGHLPKKTQIHIINETAPYNLKVAETFKVALNQGWISAPFYEQAQLELRFLRFLNGKVVHQTTGPVQHDDVARAMMEVVFALLERQVSTFLMGNVGLNATIAGGVRPWMSPTDGFEREIINQFSSPRRNRMGGGVPSSPTRGRPDLVNRGPGARPSGHRFGPH